MTNIEKEYQEFCTCVTEDGTTPNEEFLAKLSWLAGVVGCLNLLDSDETPEALALFCAENTIQLMNNPPEGV